MKFAINQSTIMQCETEEFLELCCKIGIKAVELRIPKLKDSLYRLSYQEFKNLLKKYQILVIGLNALDNFSMAPDDNLELLKNEAETVAKMCEMVECPMVVCPVATWYGTRPSDKEIRNRTISRLQIVGDIFTKYQVKIGFEPVGFPQFTVADLGLAQEIADESGVKIITLVPDIYNLFRSGHKPEAISEINYPISVFHINDTENLPLEKLNVLDNRVFPGDGIANSAAWVKEALKLKYQGYFSLEIFRKKVWEMSPTEAALLCKEKLAKFAVAVESN
jgi:2-keto-myo-inositol isomerase